MAGSSGARSIRLQYIQDREMWMLFTRHRSGSLLDQTNMKKSTQRQNQDQLLERRLLRGQKKLSK